MNLRQRLQNSHLLQTLRVFSETCNNIKMKNGRIEMDVFSFAHFLIQKTGIFSVCAPSLVGGHYLYPQILFAIFLQNDLLCNGTCSVTGG